MRFSSRLVAAVMFAAGAAACTDTRTINTPIPPGKVAGRIALNPVFSDVARTISASLADFGITFDRVRVRIRNSPDTNTVVADTTVAFGPSNENLVLNLTVPVDQIGQSFNALVEYIGTTGVVYSGTVIVQSYAPDQTAPEQPALVLSFVGPGAKLKTLTVSPKPALLVGSQTVPLTIAATDSDGAALAVPPLVFTSSDESVAKVVGAEGTHSIQSFGKRGAAIIVATTPIGISDTLSALVTLPAASIVVVSGDKQSGTVGAALTNPAVVQVNASDGVGVGGVQVTFAAPVGGSVGTTTATTDLNGRASTTMTLATGAGAQSFLATAAGFNVSVPETAVAGPASAATSTISSNVVQINADNATPATITVQTKDRFGNVIGNGGATVTLTTTLGHWGTTGTATTVTATDAANGKYTAQLFSSLSGTATITGTVAGTAIATPSATVNMIATVLDHFDVTSPSGTALGPSVQAGSTVPVRITARDASGSTVSGYTGSPTVRVTNSAFLSDTMVTAPAAVGGVTNVNLVFRRPGSNVTVDVTGTLGQNTRTSHSAPFSVSSGPAAQLIAVGPGQVVVNDFNTTPQNYPVIAITDAAGNPVPGAKMTLLMTPKGEGQPQCSVSSSSATTNADGEVVFNGETLQYPQGADFPSSCVLFVTATNQSGQALLGSPLPIALVIQPTSSGATAWTGLTDNDWFKANNWTNGVPGAQSRVFIPLATSALAGRGLNPTISADATIFSIEVEDGGQLMLANHTLSILGGDLDAHTIGLLNGGTVSLSGGDGSFIRGAALPTVQCANGGYRLLGPVQTAGSVAVNDGCDLDLNANSLSVVKDFSTSGSGSIVMTTTGSDLIVLGNATFGGGSEGDRLTTGNVIVNGNFTQTGAGTNFTPALSHNVEIGTGGAANQTVSISDPATAAFQNLNMTLIGGKTITVASQIRINTDGQFNVVSVNNGGTLDLSDGLVNMLNGPISVAGTMTVKLGGIINTSGLSFAAGTVTLTGSGMLALGNGSLFLGDNLNLVVDVTGTLTGGVPGRGCTHGTNVSITGSNTTAVAVLKQACGIP
jgi:hypothetical protein